MRPPTKKGLSPLCSRERQRSAGLERQPERCHRAFVHRVEVPEVPRVVIGQPNAARVSEVFPADTVGTPLSVDCTAGEMQGKFQRVHNRENLCVSTLQATCLGVSAPHGLTPTSGSVKVEIFRLGLLEMPCPGAENTTLTLEDTMGVSVCGAGPQIQCAGRGLVTVL